MPAISPKAPIITWAEQPLLMLRKTILAFLQGLFEQADVGCYRWSPLLNETEIVITDEAPIKLDTVGRRPAITVLRAPLQWGQTSLDQLRSINPYNDSRTHMDLLSGNISINCCSRVDLESEHIAWVAANHIWMLRRVLKKNSYIHEIGQGLSIGSPSPAGALVQGSTEAEWTNTPIGVPFHLQNNFTITPVKQTLLQSVVASMSVRMGPALGFTPTEQNLAHAPSPPKVRGRPVSPNAFIQRLDIKEK